MKDRVMTIIHGMFHKKNMKKRVIAVLIAVIIMGFALSWLNLVAFGTDPCTTMNLAIAGKLGMSLGNWQALLNVILLVIVLAFGCDNLGIGTLANMFLVGYSFDFFMFVWNQVLPMQIFDSMAVRICILLPALFVFVMSAAVYMAVELGTAPYDAVVFIIARHLPKLSFRIVRMGYDFSVILLAFLFGGKVGIATILMGFTIGPVIGFVGNKIQKYLN